MAALKIVTRCGQGPCQGRMCERLVARAAGAAEPFSARAPLRPVPLGTLGRAQRTAVVIRIPASTGVTHARTVPRPSTRTRHSWHTPIPQ